MVTVNIQPLEYFADGHLDIFLTGSIVYLTIGHYEPNLMFPVKYYVAVDIVFTGVRL